MLYCWDYGNGNEQQRWLRLRLSIEQIHRLNFKWQFSFGFYLADEKDLQSLAETSA